MENKCPKTPLMSSSVSKVSSSFNEAAQNCSFDSSFASPGPCFEQNVPLSSKMVSLVSFINSEMSSLGLKCLQTEENATCNSDVTKLSLALACVEALNRINSSLKQTQQLQLAYKSVCSQNNLQISQIKKLKNSVHSLEGEVERYKEMERKKSSDSSRTLQKLNLENKNSKKTHASLIQKISQLEHSLKRKEKECQMVKEKMDGFLVSKTPKNNVSNHLHKSTTINNNPSIQPASIDILNDNKRKRAKWMINTSCSCEESDKLPALHVIINSLEQKQHLLLSENTQLRNLLTKIDSKLNEKLNEGESSQEDISSSKLSLSSQGNSTSCAILSMPVDIMEEKVFDDFVEKISKLKTVSNKSRLNNEFSSCESLNSGEDSGNSRSDKNFSQQNAGCKKLVGSAESNLGGNSLLTDDEDC